MSAASKPKQGWLARQREARRGGWRVGVQRDLDGSRMLLAARRAAGPSFGRDFIVCAAAYMAALDERVPALEAAYEQTRAECEGEAAEAAEAKRARTVREDEEFIQSLARQEGAR